MKSLSPLHPPRQGGSGYCVPYEPLANGTLPPCPQGKTCKEPMCSADGLRCVAGYACASAYELYVYSLYFAVMTITSVGYGDVSATPFNVGEQIACTIIMLGTALVWGNLIGVFCSLAAASPAVQAFREELSQLNGFMAANNLASDLRFRLREFIHETVHLRDAEARSQLLAKLSPAMRGEVSLMVNSRWVAKVWYLQRGAQLELLIEIASRLKPQVFAPWEFCPSGIMYVVQRGSALWSARLQTAGCAFGEDVLLNNPGLQLDFPAISTTYLWVLSIDSRSLHVAVKKFPGSASRLLRMARKWTIRRAIVRAAERECHMRGVAFRGRLYPIYAKEIAQKIMERRLQAKTFTKGNFKNKMKKISLLRAMTRPGHAAVGAEPTWRKRVGVDSDSAPGKRSGTLNPLWTLTLAKSWPSGRLARRIKAAQPRAAQNSRASDLTSEMKAAANFGLQLREEELQASERQNDHDKLQSLTDEIKELKQGMEEILSMLRDKHA